MGFSGIRVKELHFLYRDNVVEAFLLDLCQVFIDLELKLEVKFHVSEIHGWAGVEEMVFLVTEEAIGSSRLYGSSLLLDSLDKDRLDIVIGLRVGWGVCSVVLTNLTNSVGRARTLFTDIGMMADGRVISVAILGIKRVRGRILEPNLLERAITKFGRVKELLDSGGKTSSSVTRQKSSRIIALIGNDFTTEVSTVSTFRNEEVNLFASAQVFFNVLNPTLQMEVILIFGPKLMDVLSISLKGRGIRERQWDGVQVGMIFGEDHI